MNEVSINDSNIIYSDNKIQENFSYFKILYIIATTIICFLGILIIIENLNITYTSSQNKIQNLILFYVVYCSFSWLIIYLLAISIHKLLIFINNNDNISNSEEDGDLKLRYITNKNTMLNKSNYLSENVLMNNSINNLDIKDRELIKSDKNKIISTNQISNFGLSGNLRNDRIKTNLNLDNEILVGNDDIEKSNKSNFVSGNSYKLSDYIKNPANKLKLIYMILMLINYFILMFIGIYVILKLIREEVMQNYKLHYKIYLFTLLSVSKSAIIVIGFVIKFVSRKIESNSVKFELNEEFLQQIEKEIQEANKISGIISPDRNLIKYNDMFNRQDIVKNSSFNLDQFPSNSHIDHNKEKKSSGNLIDIEKKSHNNLKDINNQENNKNNEDNSLDKNKDNNIQARNIFNFKIKEKSEKKKNIKVINNENNIDKKINFKVNSDYNLDLSRNPEKYNDSLTNFKEKEDKNKNNYRKSLSNQFNSKKNILVEDYDFANSKIDLEQIVPNMQEMRNSKFKIHEEEKINMKEKIKASYLENKDPQKNKMLEFKKKLEILKNNNDLLGAKSPKIEKSSKGKKIFFDENFEQKDLHELNNINKFILDESCNLSNTNIGEFKFINENDQKKIIDINDFIKNAKRISKDDFNYNSYHYSTNENVSKG